MRPIEEPFDAFVVEAMNPIPEALTVHTGKSGCVLATYSLERRCQSEHPPRSTAIGLNIGMATQLGS